MFKNLIAPMQAYLLSQGRCVGCGMPLSQGKSKKHPKGTQITCKCNRIYIKDPKSNKYRRALFNEVK